MQALKKPCWTFTGQFDEKVFSGLDFVLAEAGRRGLKLILALTNYWTPFGGMAQYVKYEVFLSARMMQYLTCTIGIASNDPMAAQSILSSGAHTCPLPAQN